MYPILFKIGPLEVGSFGVMMALAFLTCALLLRREFQREGFKLEWVNQIAFTAAIAGIAGARLYFIFENLGEFFENPLGMIFSRGGLTWYGGFIAGIMAVIWVIRKLPAPSLKIADLIAPLILLGYAIGRIGCLLAGDGDYGPPTDLPWGMTFPNGLVPTSVPVHPTPIYDTLMSLVFFTILWKLRKRLHVQGLMVSGMLMFYGLERFISEFWRNTPKILLGWMSMAQIISIISIATAIGWAFYLVNREQSSRQGLIHSKSKKGKTES